MAWMWENDMAKTTVEQRAILQQYHDYLRDRDPTFAGEGVRRALQSLLDDADALEAAEKERDALEENMTTDEAVTELRRILATTADNADFRNKLERPIRTVIAALADATSRAAEADAGAAVMRDAAETLRDFASLPANIHREHVRRQWDEAHATLTNHNAGRRLLERLEAAERVCERMRDGYNDSEALNRWERAKEREHGPPGAPPAAGGV
jgi:hypothetical protein